MQHRMEARAVRSATNGSLVSDDIRYKLKDTVPGMTTVCHPVWQLRCGGLERQLVQTVNRLHDGFRHVVVVRGWEESSEPMARQLGPHVHVLRQPGPQRDPDWSRRLAAILAEFDVDVLHVRGLTMLVDCLMANELYGDAAVAMSFHGFESAGACIEGIRRKVLREAILRCDDRWAVSAAAAAAVARELNLPRDSFAIAANGVDVDRFRPSPDRAELRNRLSLPKERRVILCVGNLKPIKGQEVLLHAMNRLGHAALNATLIMVGRDDHDGALQRWAVERLATLDVRFMGEHSDVETWYQAADVFVLPSRWEGMSNALLEAMACGLPVIATRVGGNVDVVEDGRNGLLVEPGDMESLAGAMKRLLDSESLRIELGRAARQRTVDCYSIEQTLSTYRERYRLLGDRRKVEEIHNPATATVKRVARADSRSV